MISTLPALCSHLPTSRPRSATIVMPAITAPVSNSVAAALFGSHPHPGPSRYARSVGTTKMTLAVDVTAYTQRFHAIRKPAISPNPFVAHW